TPHNDHTKGTLEPPAGGVIQVYSPHTLQRSLFCCAPFGLQRFHRAERLPQNKCAHPRGGLTHGPLGPFFQFSSACNDSNSITRDNTWVSCNTFRTKGLSPSKANWPP